MKYTKDPTRKFPRRPYYEMGEIDGITERLLQDAGRPRIGSSPAIDVDRVMMKLDLEPEFGKLEKGVMGVTFFSADGGIRIVISDDLEAAARQNRISELRLRTTQAHELGHVVLHKELYVNNTPSMFEEAVPDPMLCREEGLGTGTYSGDWWEFQANVAMAAFLMPRTDFVQHSGAWAAANGVASPAVARDGRHHAEYIAHMADLFHVSRQAAKIRADGLALGFRPDQRQLGLS